MSASRIGGGRPDLPVRDDARRGQPRPEVDLGGARPPEAVRPAEQRETFIGNVAAARQPPRLSLGEMLSRLAPTSVGALFEPELERMAQRPAEEVATDLATVFIDHRHEASEHPELAEALEGLGELLRGYEHLRILRTGELG